MFSDPACRRGGVRGKTQIDLYAAEPGPMGVAGPEVSKAVRGMVEAKGIAYHPEHQIREVDPAARRLKLAKPLPKAGVFAHGEADVVATNIAHAITGNAKQASFDGEGACFIET